MILLDTTTRSLEVLLGGVVTANQLPVVVTYVDTNLGGATPWAPASSNTVTNNTTAVTAVSAPAASTQRKVLFLSVENNDTVAATVTVQYNDNGTKRKVLVPTLQSGETLQYTDGEGFRTLDSNGAVKHAWTGYQIARGGGYVQCNADGSAGIYGNGVATYFSGGNVGVNCSLSNPPSYPFTVVSSVPKATTSTYTLAGFGSSDANGTAELGFFLRVGGNATPGSRFTAMSSFENGAGARLLVLQDLGGNLAVGKTTAGQTLDVGGNIGTDGHILFGTDNAKDVGASGATRPRSMYLATSLELESLAWVRGHPGRKRLTADATNATTTFGNLSDLSVTLVAGKKYAGRLTLKCNNSVAADGLKLDFNGGTATMTNFWAGGGVLASGGTDTVGTNVSTSLAGVINFTVLTGETVAVIEISLVCNAGGTLIPRIAENSHTTGTLTAELGSSFKLDEMNN